MIKNVELPCHWLCNWFVRRKLSLVLKEGAAWLHGGSVDRCLSSIMPTAITIDSGRLFSTLTLSLEHDTVVVKRLSHASAQQARFFLHAVYLDQQHPQAEQLLQQFNQQLSECYLRTSHWHILQQKIAGKVRPWRQADKRFLSKEHQVTFRTLEDLTRGADRRLAVLRERYVARTMQSYQLFFDQVESQPLTEWQRLACIVDEDNNILAIYDKHETEPKMKALNVFH